MDDNEPFVTDNFDGNAVDGIDGSYDMNGADDITGADDMNGIGESYATDNFDDNIIDGSYDIDGSTPTTLTSKSTDPVTPVTPVTPAVSSAAIDKPQESGRMWLYMGVGILVILAFLLLLWALGVFGSQTTGTQCTSTTDCPAGQTCTNSKCVTNPQCSSSNPCPAGQTCTNAKCVTNVTVCTITADCPTNQVCNNGTCTSIPAPTNLTGSYSVDNDNNP